MPLILAPLATLVSTKLIATLVVGALAYMVVFR